MRTRKVTLGVGAIVAVLLVAALLASDDPGDGGEQAPSVAVAAPTTVPRTTTTLAPAAPPADRWTVEVAIATTAEVRAWRTIPADAEGAAAALDDVAAGGAARGPAVALAGEAGGATPATSAGAAAGAGAPTGIVALTPDDVAAAAAQRRLLEDAHALELVEPSDEPPTAPAAASRRLVLDAVPEAIIGLGAMQHAVRSVPNGPAPTVERARGLTPIPSVGLSWGSAATDDGWSFSNPTPSGNARVFLVTGRSGSWVRVMLPTRPNQQEGWVHQDDLVLTRHQWHVEVDVSENLLRVWEGDRLELETLVVDGRASTPTPLGRFYLNERVKPEPGSFYGPWIFSTNGFSDTLERFSGEVPIFALHGGGYESTIGTDISNGCVRIPNEIVAHMGDVLPMGTPVDIHA